MDWSIGGTTLGLGGLGGGGPRATFRSCIGLVWMLSWGDTGLPGPFLERLDASGTLPGESWPDLLPRLGDCGYRGRSVGLVPCCGDLLGDVLTESGVGYGGI